MNDMIKYAGVGKMGSTIKKRKEDFMILIADVLTPNPQMRTTCAAIFQEMGLAPPSATTSSAGILATHGDT